MEAHTNWWRWTGLAAVLVFMAVSPDVLAQVGPAERLNGVAATANARSFGFLEIALLIGIPGVIVLFFVMSGDD